MQSPRDALIVGGGVAGSTCAILLAQAGWAVTLVEKQAFPRRKVCGECIAASNLDLIDALGIGEAFRAIAGPPLRRVAWCAGDTTIETGLPPLLGSSQPWGRALGREHLDTLLRDRARALGATIAQPCTVRSVHKIGDRHRCTVADAAAVEYTLDTDVVIDAHGSWQRSPFADRLPPRRARRSDLFAFKATFSSAHLTAEVLPVLAFAGGYGGMVQGDHGLLTLACCVRRDRLHQWRAQHPGVAAGEAVQQLLVREIAAVRKALAGAQREGPWLAVGPIQPRLRRVRRIAGLFAVGNAAAEAHPILGEGISMAMQSAFLLCERLVADESSASAQYATAWRHAFAWRIRLAALYAHIAMRPLATRAALPLLRRWPGLLSVGAQLGGKTVCAVDANVHFAFGTKGFSSAGNRAST